MQFAIDVRGACVQQPTGKDAWVYGCVTELLQRKHALTLYTDAELPAAWQQVVKDRSDVTVVQMASGWRWHWLAAALIRANPPDVYLSPSSFIVPFLLGKEMRCVPVIHDLIAFQPGRHNRKARFIERLLLKRVLGTSYRVCTVSASTKDDLLKWFPLIQSDNIIPIFAGTQTTPAHSAPDGKTILCVGTLNPRKNQERLIKAFALLPDDLRKAFRLVLVGSRGWGDDEVVRLAQTTENVEWKGYQDESVLATLYATATILALPSLYEGFGLPVLEAMKAGIPVLTSDRGGLQEVAGDAAVCVDPEDVQSIADGLQKLLTDDQLRQICAQKGRKQAAQYTWQRTVDLLLKALHSVNPQS